MEQIELVIRIPKKLYDTIKKRERMLTSEDFQLYEAVENGTVLPKGHGDLKDTDALKTAYGIERATKYGNESKEQLENSYSTMMMYEIADMLDYAPTIIGADKEEEGDD